MAKKNLELADIEEEAECTLADGLHLLASHHPSQQNPFTGRLTRSMFHSVFREARQRVDAPTGGRPEQS